MKNEDSTLLLEPRNYMGYNVNERLNSDLNKGILLDRKYFFLILLTVPESSLSWRQARVQDKF